MNGVLNSNENVKMVHILIAVFETQDIFLNKTITFLEE